MKSKRVEIDCRAVQNMLMKKTEMIYDYGQIAFKAVGDSNVLNLIESKDKRMVRKVAIVHPIYNTKIKIMFLLIYTI